MGIIKILKSPVRLLFFLAGAGFFILGAYIFSPELYKLFDREESLIFGGLLGLCGLFIFLSIRLSPRALLWVLVVLVLTGIIIGFLLASLNTGTGKGHRDSRRIADIRQLQLALELYFDKHNEYPPANTICDATHYYGLEVFLDGEFISAVPRDPLTSKCYFYATPYYASSSVYHLGAQLNSVDGYGLKNDEDCNSSVSGGCVEGAPPYINGFDGANDSEDKRYDVIP